MAKFAILHVPTEAHEIHFYKKTDFNSVGKYRKSLVSILSIVPITTYFLFLYVRLQFGSPDNLLYAEKNLIKISRVCCKHLLVFSGNSIRADYKYKCELPMATSLI